MSYDILPGGYEEYEDEHETAYTIGKLLEVLESTEATCVQFIGTTYTIGHLHSWRGSYDSPAFSFEQGLKSPREAAKEIREALEQTHWGYKGGEYNYTIDDKPYLAHEGSCGQEHKIVSHKFSGGTLILCTKIIPY